MSAAALCVALCAALPAQTSATDNFDLHTGSLDGWRGKGFYLTTANPKGPSLTLGLCSSDRGGPPRTGTLRYTFAVPPGTGMLRCSAAAVRRKDCPADERLNIFVITSGSEVVPMQVNTPHGWRAAPAVLSRLGGLPREYSWDLSAYAGRRLQVVLQDEDDRPGCHLFCSGFRLTRQEDTEGPEFQAFVRQLETQHKLLPLKRYDTKHFVAWSNADAAFTHNRLRNCEMMYQLFLEHYRKRGFPVHAPGGKLMVAVFDSQSGFEVCLGQKMPSGVTGVYNKVTNRLVLYDLQENEQALAARQRAFEISGHADDMTRLRFLGTVERRINDWAAGGSLSTAMHETAHHLSFNCGLLNRYGDTPLWLCEGLATYCEATDRGGWQGLGEPNPGRLFALADVVQGRRQYIPLQVLLKNDNWRDDAGSVLLGYSQSWALYRMLMQERPDALRRYLQLIYPRRTADHRLEDFVEVFGGDLSRLETHYQAYMAELVRSNATRLRQ